MRKLFALVIVAMASLTAWAQQPVKRSSEVADFNGKRCYVHVLQKGQTVHSVAQAYGNKYYEAITRKDIHTLQVGDTIWLPCKDQNTPLTSETKHQESQTPAPAAPAAQQGTYIEVKPGQTLYGISRAYNVSIEDIKALNPEVAESGLKAGQKILLPSKGQQQSQQRPAAPSKPSASNSNGRSSDLTPTQTVSAPANVKVNDRIDKNKVYVSLMMPLYLDQMNEISTTKFDLEQRGKKTYKSLEFIQFYEGVQMALKELEGRGVNVVLNVVDVAGTTVADAERAFTSHNVAHSDVVIALLTRDMFSKVAALCKQNSVFVVNPMSNRQDILDNPYVVKVMPSAAGQAEAMVNSIRRTAPGATVTVVHSNGKNEQQIKDELQKQLEQKGMKGDFVVWTADNKLVTALKKNSSNAVINIYDQDKSRNRIQVSTLLNRLSSLKSNPPVLYSIIDYTKEYADIDFGQLQQLSYHTFNYDYDETDPAQQRFLETYRDQYKTEPIGPYAGLGHDVITYFVNGLNDKGSDFWKDPMVGNLKSMLSPIHLRQSGIGRGYENQTANIRKMGDYRFVQEQSTKTSK